MHRGLAKLVDKVAKVRVVEVHVLVHICKTEGTAAVGQRGWWSGAAKDATENEKELLE